MFSPVEVGIVVKWEDLRNKSVIKGTVHLQRKCYGHPYVVLNLTTTNFEQCCLFFHAMKVNVEYNSA